MKARLLKKWGGYFAGQVLTAAPGSIPADVAEFFDDDDPALCGPSLPVINDEIDPARAAAHNNAQRAAARASRGEPDAPSEDDPAVPPKRRRSSPS